MRQWTSWSRPGRSLIGAVSVARRVGRSDGGLPCRARTTGRISSSKLARAADPDRHEVDRAAELPYQVALANRDSTDGEDEVGRARRSVDRLDQGGLVVWRHRADVGDRAELGKQRTQRRRDGVVDLTRPERGARWADLVAGRHDAHDRARVGDEMISAHGGDRRQLARTEDRASRQDQRAGNEVFTGGADMPPRLDGPVDDHRPTVDLRHLDRDDRVRAGRHGSPRRDRDRRPGRDLTRKGPAGQSTPENL
jgi:hypothetical protein